MRTATFKICIFGDGGVGKTTLVQRYVTGQFSQSTKMTIGVDMVTKQVQIENAQSRHIDKVIECSAKTGKNVESIFIEITHSIMENQDLL